jgi:hypothetical protein
VGAGAPPAYRNGYGKPRNLAMMGSMIKVRRPRVGLSEPGLRRSQERKGIPGERSGWNGPDRARDYSAGTSSDGRRNGEDL